jgi:hypothetical protein
MDLGKPCLVRQDTPTPALFHVSYEVQEAAEKVFKIKKSKPGFQKLPALLVNFQADIPLMSEDILLSIHRLRNLGKKFSGKCVELLLNRVNGPTRCSTILPI